MNYFSSTGEFSHAYDNQTEVEPEPEFCGDETVIPIQVYVEAELEAQADLDEWNAEIAENMAHSN
jgi:hypothetical protein